MNQEMTEALSAITPAEPEIVKIRPGAVVIAIELERDEARSGLYTESIGGRKSDGSVVQWRAGGRIVAIKAGKVVAKNHLTGNWSAVAGHYEVKACRAVFCQKCRAKDDLPRAIPLMHAVWDAKDRARANAHGKEIMQGWGAWRIIREAGRCECGSKVYEDIDLENRRLNDLAQWTLRSIEKMEKAVPEFVPPTFFTLVAPGKGRLPEAWNWLQTGLAGAKPNPCAAVPHQKGDRKALMFNPGRWIGQVDSLDLPYLKGLFFDGENAEEDTGFNPKGVNGL